MYKLGTASPCSTCRTHDTPRGNDQVAKIQSKESRKEQEGKRQIDDGHFRGQKIPN